MRKIIGHIRKLSPLLMVSSQTRLSWRLSEVMFSSIKVFTESTGGGVVGSAAMVVRGMKFINKNKLNIPDKSHFFIFELRVLGLLWDVIIVLKFLWR